MCAESRLCPIVKLQTFKLCTDRTPSIHFKSFNNCSIFILFGTASRIIFIESFIIEQVVVMTISENINVHKGSTIFAFG